MFLIKIINAFFAKNGETDREEEEPIVFTDGFLISLGGVLVSCISLIALFGLKRVLLTTAGISGGIVAVAGYLLAQSVSSRGK